MDDREEDLMKRAAAVCLIVFGLAVAASAAEAGRRNDGRPDGGNLAYGEYGRPATLDPVTSNEMVSLRVAELVFNGLVGIDEKQEIGPELAERWEISKDGTMYVFFLRKDVTWHPRPNEAPKAFTADDVVFTHNIMMNP